MLIKKILMICSLSSALFSTSPDEMLFIAAHNGDVSLIEPALQCNAYINSADDFNMTPLMYASLYGHWQIVTCLLANDADVTVKSTIGSSALMIALQSGHSYLAEELLNHGADIDDTDPFARTPLILASIWGSTELVDLLLKYKADTCKQDITGRTALMYAIMYKNLAIAIKLLDASYQSINIEDDKGNTALFYAIDNDNLVRTLVTYGANVEHNNKVNVTPLQLAIMCNREESIRLFIAALSMTRVLYPLNDAFELLRYEVVNEVKALFNAIVSSDIKTVLGYPNTPTGLRQLLEAKPYLITSRDHKGFTLLLEMVCYNQRDRKKADEIIHDLKRLYPEGTNAFKK